MISLEKIESGWLETDVGVFVLTRRSHGRVDILGSVNAAGEEAFIAWVPGARPRRFSDFDRAVAYVDESAASKQGTDPSTMRSVATPKATGPQEWTDDDLYAVVTSDGKVWAMFNAKSDAMLYISSGTFSVAVNAGPKIRRVEIEHWYFYDEGTPRKAAEP